MAETSTLPCDETATVSVALFVEVKNIPEIREGLRKGKVDACLLTPRLVVDKLQVLTSANKAYHSSNHGKRITKNLYSEVIYTASPSKNISESFKNFGVREDDTSLVAVLFNDKDGQKLRALKELIDGNVGSLDALPSLYERDSVMKIYKVTEGELQVGTLTEAVVQRIALKDII